MVTLLNACCGCTLQKGTMIIGILEAVFSTILLIVSISSSVALDTVGDAGELEEVRETLYTMFVISAVTSAINLTISILLVVGAAKEKHRLMVPWMIYVIVYMGFYLASVIVNSIAYFEKGYDSYAISYITSAVIGFCFQLYFLLVVFSYYRILRNPALVQPPMYPTYPVYPTYPNFARDGNA